MKTLLYLFVIFLLVSSCKKEEQFSKLPEVAFKDFLIYRNAAGIDTTVDFVFTFKDGDGDIGYEDNEFDPSCGADNNNLYIAYEERRGNDFYPKKLWTQVTEITAGCDTLVYFDSVQIQFNQRMQYVEPPGNKKSIEGEVKYRMDYNSAVILLSRQGRFQFYIRDRAKNKSNVVITPELVLSK